MAPWPISSGELLIIFIILLLILGPSKLPMLARSLGESIRELRRAALGVVEDEEKGKGRDREGE